MPAPDCESPECTPRVSTIAKEPSAFLNAIALAFLCSPEDTHAEDVLRAMFLRTCRAEGIDGDALLEQASAHMRERGMFVVANEETEREQPEAKDKTDEEILNIARLLTYPANTEIDAYEALQRRAIHDDGIAIGEARLKGELFEARNALLREGMRADEYARNHEATLESWKALSEQHEKAEQRAEAAERERDEAVRAHTASEVGRRAVYSLLNAAKREAAVRLEEKDRELAELKAKVEAWRPVVEAAFDEKGKDAFDYANDVQQAALRIEPKFRPEGGEGR